MVVVTLTHHPKSVHNYCVIEEFGGVYVLSICFSEFSFGEKAFVMGRSQVKFFS